MCIQNEVIWESGYMITFIEHLGTTKRFDYVPLITPEEVTPVSCQENIYSEKNIHHHKTKVNWSSLNP